ncbi:MAG: ribosome assembly cofactor RimP [Alistipes sp.]|jgi:ribosome maturation factor RimP|nr:ribosome assembly cofactor RimP [Alistipes sp.]
MVDIHDIGKAAEEALSDAGESGCDGGLFIVEVKGRGDEFEVFVDADGTGDDGKPRRVTVEDCVALTKAIEGRFDRELPEDDFALTVSSAGIGQPLRVARQYRKLVGRPVEVVLTGGARIAGTLEGVEGNGAGELPGRITLAYPEKQRVEGQKRPQIVTVTKTFPLAEVKSTMEYIDFK